MLNQMAHHAHHRHFVKPPFVQCVGQHFKFIQHQQGQITVERLLHFVEPLLKVGKRIVRQILPRERGQNQVALLGGTGDRPGQIVEKAGVIAGAGGRALQIDKQGDDGAGQQAAQIVEQGGLAHAPLAIEQQRRLPPIQQQLFNAGADVGAADEDFLLLGEGDADDVRAVDFLAQLRFGDELLIGLSHDFAPGGGDGAEAVGVPFVAAGQLAQQAIQPVFDGVEGQPLVVGAFLALRGDNVAADAAEAAQQSAGRAG